MPDRGSNDYPVTGVSLARTLQKTQEELVNQNLDLKRYQADVETQNEALRTARDHLEEAQLRDRALYNLAPIGYLSLDEGGRIREANVAALRLLDRGRDAMLGKRFSDFLAHDCQDDWFMHQRRAFSERQPEALEVVLISANCTSCLSSRASR